MAPTERAWDELGHRIRRGPPIQDVHDLEQCLAQEWAAIQYPTDILPEASPVHEEQMPGVHQCPGRSLSISQCLIKKKRFEFEHCQTTAYFWI